MTDTTPTNSRRIVIFDTTLRDGEQSPGASMNLTEKMEVAQALLALGVDVHRGRLPHRLARRFRGRAARSPARSAASQICGLARCREADIDRAWEAVRHAEQPRIHVFLATSAIHREFKLKMDKEEHHPACGGRRRTGGGLLPQRRVLARGRRPHRDRFPLPGGRGGHRRRRHHGQHPRHGRLRHAQPHAPRHPARCATACRTSTRP